MVSDYLKTCKLEEGIYDGEILIVLVIVMLNVRCHKLYISKEVFGISKILKVNHGVI